MEMAHTVWGQHNTLWLHLIGNPWIGVSEIIKIKLLLHGAEICCKHQAYKTSLIMNNLPVVDGAISLQVYQQIILKAQLTPEDITILISDEMRSHLPSWVRFVFIYQIIHILEKQ